MDLTNNDNFQYEKGNMRIIYISNNQQQGGGMWPNPKGYCYHPEVDYHYKFLFMLLLKQ